MTSYTDMINRCKADSWNVMKLYKTQTGHLPKRTIPPNSCSVLTQCAQDTISARLKWRKLEADHWPPTTAKAKNVWSYTSVRAYIVQAWCSAKCRDGFQIQSSIWSLTVHPPHGSYLYFLIPKYVACCIVSNRNRGILVTVTVITFFTLECIMHILSPHLNIRNETTGKTTNLSQLLTNYKHWFIIYYYKRLKWIHLIQNRAQW
jgi:hypothetical protein